MALLDILRAFKRTQPAGKVVEVKDFVKSQLDVERTIDSVLQFCRSIAPSGLVLSASLTASQVAAFFDDTGMGMAGKPWAGWAICNGNNGTPDLDGKFPRFDTEAAGGTGGSDSSAHTHAEGSLMAHINLNASNEVVMQRANVSYNTTHKSTVSGFTASVAAVLNGAVISGTTAAASSTDNRPAFYGLVPVMRL